MGYRKYTDTKEHEERCAAIVAHLEVAERLKDRRLADAAHYLSHRLDDRRKTPWGGSDMAIYTRVLALPSAKEGRYGSFTVTFNCYASEGLSYIVYRATGVMRKFNDGTEEEESEYVAQIPISVSFDPIKTAEALRIARDRADAIAVLLDDSEATIRNG